MLKRWQAAAAVSMAIAMMVFGAGSAFGQNFPDRPIRIVTSEPGGGTDFASRLIAQGLTGNIGQQVLVDNRPNGVITVETVVRAQPDGHTLLLLGGSVWLLPFLQTVSWDPVRDLMPVTNAMRAVNVLVLHPSVPAKSAGELIALAKAKPGSLNYGTSGGAASNLLSAELFKAMAGVNIVRVTFKGTGPALISLLSSEIQVMFPTPASVMGHIKAGRLKGLAVTSAEPSALVPGLPTIAATGLPGFESVSPFGIFAPAHTPPARITRLNHEIVRVLKNESIKEKFATNGVEVIGSTPQQLAATIKSEMARMGKVIKDAGIRGE